MLERLTHLHGMCLPTVLPFFWKKKEFYQLSLFLLQEHGKILSRAERYQNAATTTRSAPSQLSSQRLKAG